MTAKRKVLHRLALVFLGVPIIALFGLCDAVACAWDELAGDWRSFKHWFIEEWRQDE